MDDLTKVLTVIFGGVITLAIVSVIVGRKSKAPEAIQSLSSGLAKVVGAAVTMTPNGDNGHNAFTDPPDWSKVGSYIGGAGFHLPSVKGF